MNPPAGIINVGLLQVLLRGRSEVLQGLTLHPTSPARQMLPSVPAAWNGTCSGRSIGGLAGMVSDMDGCAFDYLRATPEEQLHVADASMWAVSCRV